MSVRLAIAAVVLALPTLADEPQRVAFPANYQQGAIDCGAWTWDPVNRGRCVTTMSRTDGGEMVTGAYGVVVNQGVASCSPASSTDAGCLSAGTQDIWGQKNFQHGIWSVGDIYTSASILGYPGHQVLALGARTYGDTSAAVVVGNQIDRDGGGVILAARAGPTNDMVVITEEGNVSLSCGNAATTGQCSFVDATGVSGHVSATTTGANYFAIAGHLGDPAYVAGYGWDAGLPDGGNPDGGAANTDGGNLYLWYYPYGGRHGDVTVLSKTPNQYSNAWVFQTKTEGTDDWFFVQRNGGFGQANQGHAFASFGETAPNILTDKGQYYPWGDHATVLRFGRGSTDNDQRWAWKKESGGPADGGWGIIPDRAEVLRVVGQTSQTVQFGTSAFVAGSKTITFAAAFGGVPVCTCTTISTTVPCSRNSVGTSSAIFNGTGTDAFDWQCMGPK